MSERLALKLDVIADRRLPELVAEQLAAAIRSGQLRPGDRLPTEHELMQRMGVGRTSVREALQKLQTQGLVEKQKGRGSFVASTTPSSAESFAAWSAEQRFAITEMIELRLAVEGLAASLAAVRANPEQIAEIQSWHLKHLGAGQSGSLADIVSTDDRFHRAIAEASGNRALLRLIEGLSTEAFEFRRRTHALPGRPATSAEGHASILDAIRAGNISGARVAMGEHLWPLYSSVQEAAQSAGSEKPSVDPAPEEIFSRS